MPFFTLRPIVQSGVQFNLTFDGRCFNLKPAKLPRKHIDTFTVMCVMIIGGGGEGVCCRV